MPLINADLAVEYTASSWLLIAGNVAALLTTLLLIPALNRWSTRYVGMGIAMTTLVVCLSAPLATSLSALVALAAAIGIVLAAMGVLCNVLAMQGSPVATRGRMLAALHTMYGLGSMAASLYVGWGADRLAWQQLLWLPALLSMPLIFLLWREKDDPTAVQNSVRQSGRLTGVQLLMLAIFAFYVAGEVTTSMWLTAFLVDGKGYTVSEASPYLAGFFLCMSVTRISCAFLRRHEWEPILISGSLGLAILALVAGHAGATYAFCLAGCFGPFFPLFLASVSRAFPKQWQALTVWVIVIMQLVLATLHLSLGRLTDKMGIEISFRLPVIMLLAALFVYFIYRRRIRGSEGEA